MNWDDLKLFLLVARHGGLTAAARAAGLSAPTLGRRLQALEAALGRTLFEHRATGYTLTAAGRDLLAQAEPVEMAMLGVERWRDHGAAGRVVRVSAGTWMSRFLAQNVATLTGRADTFRLRFLPAEERLDIGRRAADIGLRNRRPEEAWLAGQHLGRAAFAIYGPAGAPAPEAFVAPTETLTPSSQWLRSEHGGRVGIEVGSPRLILDLVRAGAGRAVLPCFVGDAEPGLARLSRPIAELEAQSWLVLHHDERHDPAVRAVARRIVRLMRAAATRFQGSAPEQPEPARE